MRLFAVIFEPAGEGAGEDHGAHGEDEGEADDYEEHLGRHSRNLRIGAAEEPHPLFGSAIIRPGGGRTQAFSFVADAEYG